MPPVSDPTIQLALQRFQFTAEAEKENRTAMKGDLEFYVSDQWDSAVRSNRMTASRPCLTINRLPQFTRQITNQLRQNMPGVRTIPVNDSDEDVAKIFDGMMRHIQESSQSGIAYSTANNSQVICGIGFFRVVTEYSNDTNFDKEIKIKRIKNSLAVYVDPSAIEPDYSDAQFMFITEDLTFQDFERRFPGKTTVTNDLLTSVGDPIREWKTDNKNTMRIAEYFAIEDGDEVTIYQLQTGEIVTKLPEGVKSAQKRTITQKKVIWRRISAVEVLEEIPWDGKYIPIIPAIGEDMDVDGKRIIKGMVRDAIDPQRQYNYQASSQVEMVALAPKAPYMVAVGQIDGLKQYWDTLNTQNWAYLPYNPISTEGTLVGAPQRNNVEPPIQAMAHLMSQAADDLKATTGIYDAALGARGNETSGKAINARKLQGDVSNYHYADNFSYSLLHLGRILLDLIPKTYDTARVVRILQEDGTSEYKKVNQPSGEKTLEGMEKFYDLSAGQYDVVVETGPSYKTKRQEDSELMAQMAQGNPELMKVAGDIIVRNMDLPGAQELSERIKKTLPPELQDVDPSQEIPIKLKQQLDQYTMIIDQLTQTVNHLQDEKDQKKMELESKERIALEQITADITLKAMDQAGAGSMAMLQSELKGIGERLSLIGINQPIDSQNPQIPQNQNVESNNLQIDTVDSNDTINPGVGGNEPVRP